MQQAIDTAQIDKGAVIGEVLDDALPHHAFFQHPQQLFALDAVGGFHHRAAGYHDIVAFLIELDNLEFEGFVLEMGGLPNRTHVHQGPRQEGAHAIEIDGEAALDLAADHAGDRFVVLEGGFQHHPGFCATGLFPGQTGRAEPVLDRLQGHLNLVADGNRGLALFIEELAEGDDAFGLQASVNGYPILVDVDDDPGDNGAGRHFDGLQAFFEQLGKTFAHGVGYS